MPRLSFAAVAPPLLIAVLVALFLHSWTAGPETPPPAPSTAALKGDAATGSTTPPRPAEGARSATK
jgi:hypothetical protein